MCQNIIVGVDVGRIAIKDCDAALGQRIDNGWPILAESV